MRSSTTARQAKMRLNRPSRGGRDEVVSDPTERLAEGRLQSHRYLRAVIPRRTLTGRAVANSVNVGRELPGDRVAARDTPRDTAASVSACPRMLPEVRSGAGSTLRTPPNVSKGPVMPHG